MGAWRDVWAQLPEANKMPPWIISDADNALNEIVKLKEELKTKETKYKNTIIKVVKMMEQDWTIKEVRKAIKTVFPNTGKVWPWIPTSKEIEDFYRP